MTSIDLGIAGISEATPVGQGGFGVVYRARQEAVGRTVAVKLLSVATLGDEERRRFERECQVLGALSGHPNIVAVFDSGISSEQRPYLIMEYLSGGTLADGLKRDGPVSWQVAAALGVKLAAALAAAHAAAILHRDVKPENVLMSAYGEPQLVDFGIARLVGGSHSRTGAITATLAHAAPEVLAGQGASEASDVYSLASTLYELLRGNAPFVRPTDESFHPLLQRAITEDPPDLRQHGLPDAIWKPLSAALAKDPAARASARAFGSALQDAQRALSMEATPLVAAPSAPPAVAEIGAEARTVMRPRRGAGRAPEPAAPAGASRPRRSLMVIAGAALAILLVAAGAAALLGGGSDDAPERIAATTTTARTSRMAEPNGSSGAASQHIPPDRSRRGARSGDAPAAGQTAPPPPAAGRSGAPRSSAPSPRTRPSSGERSRPAPKPMAPKPPPAASAAPPAVTPPPPPPPPPPVTSDRFGCGSAVSVSWSSERVQPCPLVSPLPPRGWIPVYARPVARPAGALAPSAAGWLHGVADQRFVCQRKFADEYVHPQGDRNNWWAYTRSDDGVWGWVPQVFFKGGNDDEPDAGLAPCAGNHS